MLLGGVYVPKSDLRIEAYGTVDELNAYIGLLYDLLSFDNGKVQMLRSIQNELFSIGAHLARAPEKENVKLPPLNETLTEELERDIDSMSANLPPLKHFLLPGPSYANALVHVARTVCRRAERRCVQLHSIEPIHPHILSFLNRLSDWLFVLARYVSASQNQPEIPWIPNTPYE